ncbi:MAG: sugar phosphate isomerase/epimerase [Ruminococcaceae bacterium]|nr:sugar phosphate isomerase/epimerase [Oscillospiraceae bacterium]
MKLCIRGHDLGAWGINEVVEKSKLYGVDGLQLVCYKVFDETKYEPGSITEETAKMIGAKLAEKNISVPLIGAYFNPVHSNKTKVENCKNIYKDYLKYAKILGSECVGSETGSFNDDDWSYNPKNRTDEALQEVVYVFSELCDYALDYGSYVAMEGAAGHVCYNVETLAKAQKIMNRKNTRVIFDLFNYMDKDNQGDYLDILDRGLDTFGDKILLFHMKDCTFRNDGAPVQVPYGKGEMNIPEILKRIKAHNKNAVLTLEDTAGEHIPHAVETIRRIWEEV